MREFATFAEFWPHYVREHGQPLTRALHFVGTSAALVFAAIGLGTGRLWCLPVGLTLGYGPAWVGHFFIEKNRPATFRHPLWSLRADLRMWRKMVTGQMPAEVTRCRADLG